MKTRVINVRDLTTEDQEAWRRLSERALEPNPFFGPAFLTLCCRHFDNYGSTRLVVAEEGREFKAALPIVATRRSRLPPGRVAFVRASPSLAACLDTPLIDRSSPDASCDALLDGLARAAQHEGVPGMVMLEQMAWDGPVADSLRRVCGERRTPIHVKELWERGTVSRGGSWAKPIDGDRRREIARRQRLLAKDTGAEVTLVDRTKDPAAGEEFLAMEASGWKGRDEGLALVRRPATAAWFRDWYVRAVDDGTLTILSLDVGATSVAMQFYVRCGEGFFCFRIGFDSAYAKYKPGAMLLALAVNHLRDTTDAAWIDSTSDAGNTFFLGMLPERRLLSQVLIGTGGRLDRALVSALPVMTGLANAQKGMRKRLSRESPT